MLCLRWRYDCVNVVQNSTTTALQRRRRYVEPLTAWQPVCLNGCTLTLCGNNNNIITKTMFMVLSSWQSHCESSPGSFDECRMTPSGRRPKTKPGDLGCVSACTAALSVRLSGNIYLDPVWVIFVAWNFIHWNYGLAKLLMTVSVPVPLLLLLDRSTFQDAHGQWHQFLETPT